MKDKRPFISSIKNSRGMITAEFIFSMVICAGICIVLFALNFTLSMAEVAQYIAFSTARAHAASQIDQNKQIEVARDKYRALLAQPPIATIFNKPDGDGWFVLSTPNDVEIRGGGDFDSGFAEYPTAEDRVPQVGVRFKFRPRILNMRIAFLGNTSEDPDAGFEANITAMMIREPTVEECWRQQLQPRYDAILNLDPRYRVLGDARKNEYVAMEDNGC